MPSFVYANVRSVFSKISELQLFISNKHFDIVSVTESWLTPDIPDCAINLPGYTAFRNDRIDRRGGGVCVWVSTNITAERFYPTLEKPSCIEICFMLLKSSNALFITVYIPPNLHVNTYDEINTYIISAIDEALTLWPNLECFLLGDFNRAPMEKIAENYSLIPIINCATRGNVILDQLYVPSMLANYITHEVGSPFGTSDHGTICASDTRQKKKVQYTTHYVRDFRTSNIDAFICALDSICFDDILNDISCMYIEKPL